MPPTPDDAGTPNARTPPDAAPPAAASPEAAALEAVGGTARTAPDPVPLPRRRFLVRLSLGLSAFAATLVGVPVVGFVLEPLFHRTPQVWRAVGAVDAFQQGKTVEVTYEEPSSLPWAGVTSQSGAWLQRTGDQTFRAFSIQCTHLGCTVRWVASANLFMCPCHGGVFYADGTVAAGPPPRPLAQIGVRVRGGQVEVETSGVPITRGTLNGGG